MKKLNQHCLNVRIYMFIYLCSQCSHINQLTDFSLFTTTLKHWEQHIYFFIFTFFEADKNLSLNM